MNIKSKILPELTKTSQVDFNTILRYYSDCIKNKKKGTINYFNLNSINIISKNKEIENVLNRFDMTHPDGVGIWLLGKIYKIFPKIKRFNWTDNAINFLNICQQNNWKIFFLGSKPEIISLAYTKTKQRFPNLNITGFQNGYSLFDNSSLIDIINLNKPDIIWVGLGMPKQEEWIQNNIDSINCYVLHAVGDIFSELAGVKVRGPKIARNFGLEWVFRSLYNPKYYFKRYFNNIFLLIKLILFSIFNKK